MKKMTNKEQLSSADNDDIKPDFRKSESIDFYSSDSADEENSVSTKFTKKSEKSWEPIRQYKKNTTVSVYDVAAYILKKKGEMSAMKLQKLVYYCQAWSLVWDEELLFSENIEAWANGPVIRELFSYHRGYFKINAVTIGNPDKLSQVQIETVNSVIDYYGDKSAQWLIDLSHDEDPWKDTRKGLPDLERGSRIISLDSIADYYSSL